MISSSALPVPRAHGRQVSPCEGTHAEQEHHLDGNKPGNGRRQFQTTPQPLPGGQGRHLRRGLARLLRDISEPFVPHVGDEVRVLGAPRAISRAKS